MSYVPDSSRCRRAEYVSTSWMNCIFDRDSLSLAFLLDPLPLFPVPDISFYHDTTIVTTDLDYRIWIRAYSLEIGTQLRIVKTKSGIQKEHRPLHSVHNNWCKTSNCRNSNKKSYEKFHPMKIFFWQSHFLHFQLSFAHKLSFYTNSHFFSFSAQQWSK